MKNAPRNLSQKAHRQLIGILGLCLPLVVYVLAGVRPLPELKQWAFLGSVSAYYYTGSVSVFVGVIFALSLFLFTYPGYENVIADRVVGIIGGFAALGVVAFPTGPPVEPLLIPWWRSWMAAVHYISASSLFVCFAVFSLWLFQKSEFSVRDRPPEKRRRNYLYLACGVVIIMSLLWALCAGIEGQPIFLPEAFAIVAFALSWLVKGEADQTAMRAVSRILPRRRA